MPKRVIITAKLNTKLERATARLRAVQREILERSPGAADVVFPEAIGVKTANELAQEYLDSVRNSIAPRTVVSRADALKRFSNFIGLRLITRQLAEEWMQ